MGMVVMTMTSEISLHTKKILREDDRALRVESRGMRAVSEGRRRIFREAEDLKIIELMSYLIHTNNPAMYAH